MLLTLPQARKALYHATMCQRINGGYASFYSWAMGSPGSSAHSIFSISNVAGILENPKETMVAFQGSDDIAGVLLDLDCALRPTPFGGVHEGFQFVWGVYEPQFLSALKNIDPKKERPVSVTGHSLGAALAALAGACAARHGYMVKDSYLFGSPRTGDHAWVEACAGTGAHLVRVVNGQDLVTRVPFWKGYEHLPNVFHVDRSGKGSDTRSFSLKSLLWDNWTWAFPDIRNDHDIHEYIKSLGLYVKQLEASAT